MTQSTKKIDSELPFSASTAEINGAVVVVVVVVEGVDVFGVSVVKFLTSRGVLNVTLLFADGVAFLSRLTEELISGTFTIDTS